MQFYTRGTSLRKDQYNLALPLEKASSLMIAILAWGVSNPAGLHRIHSAVSASAVPIGQQNWQYKAMTPLLSFKVFLPLSLFSNQLSQPFAAAASR